jgi:hypothetical protein
MLASFHVMTWNKSFVQCIRNFAYGVWCVYFLEKEIILIKESIICLIVARLCLCGNLHVNLDQSTEARTYLWISGFWKLDSSGRSLPMQQSASHFFELSPLTAVPCH